MHHCFCFTTVNAASMLIAISIISFSFSINDTDLSMIYRVHQCVYMDNTQQYHPLFYEIYLYSNSKQII